MWVCGITGLRAAIELAADSIVFVIASEELGLRRRMLMEEEVGEDMVKCRAKNKRV